METKPDHIGDRYLQWDRNVAPNQTPAQRAHALDTFADEFDALPPGKEPTSGWAEEMAHLCRNQACVLRGEPEAEWVPRWGRHRRAVNGAVRPQGSAPVPVATAGDDCVAEEVVSQPAV